MSQAENATPVVQAAQALGGKRTLGWVWPVLILFAFALSSLAAGIIEEIVEGESFAFDQVILEAFRDPENPSRPIGPGWLLQVATDISALGGFTLLWMFGAAGIGYLALRGKRSEAGWLAASVVGASVLNTLLKSFFHRDRPAVVPHLTEVSTASFPSGHAMISAAVYLTLGMMLAQSDPRPLRRAYLMGFMCLLVLLIGWSRVFLGVHWPSDVVAGWCLGAVWALAVFAANRLLRQRKLRRTTASAPEPAAADQRPAI